MIQFSQGPDSVGPGDLRIPAVDRRHDAANRDPEVFPNPDKLDLERSPNKHIAFGVGMHRCIGSHMATAMCEIVTEQTLRRMPDLKIDRDRSRRYQSTGVLNGWAELWGTFTPGDRSASAMAG